MDSVDSGQLLMGTLQVELDRRSGRLLYAWGYHPAESWHRADLPVVAVITSAVVVSGIPALQIDEGFEVWPWEQPLVSIWDDGRRLLRVGPQPVQPESVLIEFAEGEFLETESTGHAIYALWIQLAVE